MKGKSTVRFLSLILAFCMIFSVMLPAAAFAAEEEISSIIGDVLAAADVADEDGSADEAANEPAEETATEVTEAPVEDPAGVTSEEETTGESAAEESVPAAETAEPAEAGNNDEAASADEDSAADETVQISDYASFLAGLKILEGYAEAYYSTNASKDVNELVINFVRTGYSKYNDSDWETLAEPENTAFISYVEEMDEENGTNVMALRDTAITFENMPNGQIAEFGHMFATMNIAYVNKGSADFGGWLGDICDLMYYSDRMMTEEGYVHTGSVDELADRIRLEYFGDEEEDAFGFSDFYGDMDAYYFVRELEEGAESLSALMEKYYTSELKDEHRAAYFLNNRFDGLETQEDVRTAIYDTYCANLLANMLETNRGIEKLTDLRTASCYAVADYMYALAADLLEGDTGDDSGEGEGGEGDEPGEDGDDSSVGITNEYYTIFSSTKSTIAPGVTQYINYAMSADNKQLAFYIAEVDINREDVSIHANYKDNDPTLGWGMQRVTDQMAAAVAKHSDPDSEYYVENYTAVVGVNGDFFNMSTGAPSGALVMEGELYCEARNENFFAILEDGTAVIGTPAEWEYYKSLGIQEALGGSIMLVQDGVSVVKPSSSYYNDRASRTCVGITADNKVIMMVLDGRQEPFSAGGSAQELAQIMIDAGCVTAMNLDGGGSTTFAAKPEGSDTVTVVNRPSDGYQRNVSSSLMVVSTAKSSNEFEYAKIETEYDYLTVNTELAFTAVGVSNTGNAASIPENAYWQLSDGAIGILDEENGVFIAIDEGEVDIQLMLEGKVVGSKTLHVVTPDKLAMDKTSINAVYGIPVELPLLAYYKGNPVAVNLDDLSIQLAVNEGGLAAGVVNGLEFIGDESTGIRNTVCTIALVSNEKITTSIKINIYKADEAIFDYDNVTAGDRQLAWNRVVSNSEIAYDGSYHALDTEEAMVTDYTFALDMTEIEIPDKLKDLIYMLPGAEDATAWDFLLQLAERISVLSEVCATVQFDADVDVDWSGLKIVNEYFKLNSDKTGFNEETNTLTIVCTWVDQTESIDPDTANPNCIISGIKLTPKADAQWDSANRLEIANVGEISYKIYMRTSFLYSFASKPENQEEFGLMPYSSTEVLYNGGPEQGGYFGDTYVSFNDTYVLDKTNRNGWFSENDQMYYYVDNVRQTGVQYIPSLDNPTVKHFCHFNDMGIYDGSPMSGLVEMDGKLYYAVLGVMRTGWQTNTVDGEVNYYYFKSGSGEAADGEQTIDGYNYVFTDHILTLGDLRYVQNHGWHYMWAGKWVYKDWVEINGELYYAEGDSYFVTGLFKWYHPETSEYGIFIMDDETGRWMQELDGMYEYNGKVYYADHGTQVQYPGIIYEDGYYYYFTSSHTLLDKDTAFTYWTSKGNGLMPNGSYNFDAEGRILNPRIDLNGDKMFNAADLVSLMKYLADNNFALMNLNFGNGGDSGTVADRTNTEDIADINMDSSVDILDVIALVRVLANQK